MRDALIVCTPHPSDYPELTEVWEKSVRATHHFLPDSYIRQLRPLVEQRYLDAVMLICCRDRDGRISGFAGVATGKVENAVHPPAPPWTRHRYALAAVRRRASQCQGTGSQRAEPPRPWPFTRKQGFEVVSRSPVDGLGQPYPLLRMCLAEAQTARA